MQPNGLEQEQQSSFISSLVPSSSSAPSNKGEISQKAVLNNVNVVRASEGIMLLDYTDENGIKYGGALFAENTITGAPGIIRSGFNSLRDSLKDDIPDINIYDQWTSTIGDNAILSLGHRPERNAMKINGRNVCAVCMRPAQLYERVPPKWKFNGTTSHKSKSTKAMDTGSSYVTQQQPQHLLCEQISLTALQELVEDECKTGDEDKTSKRNGIISELHEVRDVPSQLKQNKIKASVSEVPGPRMDCITAEMTCVNGSIQQPVRSNKQERTKSDYANFFVSPKIDIATGPKLSFASEDKRTLSKNDEIDNGLRQPTTTILHNCCMQPSTSTSENCEAGVQAKAPSGSRRVVWAKCGSAIYWPAYIDGFRVEGGATGASLKWFGCSTYSPFIEISKIEPFIDSFDARFNPKREPLNYHKGVALAIVACLPQRGYFEHKLSPRVYKILTDEHHVELGNANIVVKRRKRGCSVGPVPTKWKAAKKAAVLNGEATSPTAGQWLTKAQQPRPTAVTEAAQVMRHRYAAQGQCSHVDARNHEMNDSSGSSKNDRRKRI